MWFIILLLMRDAEAADLCRIPLKRALMQMVKEQAEARQDFVEISGKGALRFTVIGSSLRIDRIEAIQSLKNDPKLFDALYSMMVAKNPRATEVIFPNGNVKEL